MTATEAGAPRPRTGPSRQSCDQGAVPSRGRTTESIPRDWTRRGDRAEGGLQPALHTGQTTPASQRRGGTSPRPPPPQARLLPPLPFQGRPCQGVQSSSWSSLAKLATVLCLQKRGDGRADTPSLFRGEDVILLSWDPSHLLLSRSVFWRVPPLTREKRSTTGHADARGWPTPQTVLQWPSTTPTCTTEPQDAVASAWGTALRPQPHFNADPASSATAAPSPVFCGTWTLRSLDGVQTSTFLSAFKRWKLEV